MAYWGGGGGKQCQEVCMTKFPMMIGCHPTRMILGSQGFLRLNSLQTINGFNTDELRIFHPF